MKNLTCSFACLFFSLIVNKEAVADATSELDHYLQAQQRQHQVPGIAAVILREGRSIYQFHSGLATIIPASPVTQHTVFPLFSSTKIFSVIAVYQAIEANKFQLDSRIGDLLDELPHAWRDRKIRDLISHASGLPDIVNFENLNESDARKAVYALPLKFPAGQEFDYNQTNFWLLNRLFHKLYGQSLAQFILAKQFAHAPASVFFETDAAQAHPNYSPGYNNTGMSLEKRNWHFPSYNLGAAGLNLSLLDFIRWDQQFDQAKLINKTSMAMLYTPVNYEKPHSFAQGWDKIELAGIKSYGFSGGMATIYRKVPEKKLTLILLSNGMWIPAADKPGLNQIINQMISYSMSIQGAQ